MADAGVTPWAGPPSAGCGVVEAEEAGVPPPLFPRRVIRVRTTADDPALLRVRPSLHDLPRPVGRLVAPDGRLHGRAPDMVPAIAGPLETVLKGAWAPLAGVTPLTPPPGATRVAATTAAAVNTRPRVRHRPQLY